LLRYVTKGGVPETEVVRNWPSYSTNTLADFLKLITKHCNLLAGNV